MPPSPKTSKSWDMDCKIVKFSRHALERIFERGISESDVEEIIRNGETIEEYPEDMPYPSRLLLGWRNGCPLHVVAAYDPVSGLCVIITAYVPDATEWDRDCRVRRDV